MIMVDYMFYHQNVFWRKIFHEYVNFLNLLLRDTIQLQESELTNSQGENNLCEPMNGPNTYMVFHLDTLTKFMIIWTLKSLFAWWIEPPTSLSEVEGPSHHAILSFSQVAIDYPNNH